MNKIEEGEVVVETGATQRMTVEEVAASSALCVWFDERDELHRSWFLLSNLEAVE